MRKEILYAIVAGALFGLVIAFGIWKANSSVKPQGAEDIQTQQEESDSPETASGEGITLVKPGENQVVTSEELIISGITNPNNHIIISTENKDYFVNADKKGGFEENIKLISGMNKIIITSIDSHGKTFKKALPIVYSTKFDEASSDKKDDNENDNKTNKDDSDEATESSSSVRQIVQKKINFAKNTPVFYAGTVTDISEETIQIKQYLFDKDSGESEEIEQIAIKNDTNYVSIGKTSKSIKFSDIAIGDFIIAMGYKNKNNVLETTRLLVTTTPTFPNINTFMASLESITSKKITVNTIPDNKKLESKITKDSTVIKENHNEKEMAINELEKSDKLIIVEVGNDKEKTVRSIFIINENAEVTETPSPNNVEKNPPQDKE